MNKREVVLPSGRFASIRTMTCSDLAACYNANVMLMSAALASRIVSIDDEPVAFDQIMQMEAAEFFPINEMICKEITEAMKFKDGVS